MCLPQVVPLVTKDLDKRQSDQYVCQNILVWNNPFSFYCENTEMKYSSEDVTYCSSYFCFFLNLFIDKEMLSI